MGGLASRMGRRFERIGRVCVGAGCQLWSRGERKGCLHRRHISLTMQSVSSKMQRKEKLT